MCNAMPVCRVRRNVQKSGKQAENTKKGHLALIQSGSAFPAASASCKPCEAGTILSYGILNC